MQIGQIEFFPWVVVLATLSVALLVFLIILVQRIRFQAVELARLDAERIEAQEAAMERQVRSDGMTMEKERQLSALEALLSQKEIQLSEAQDHIKTL